MISFQSIRMEFIKLGIFFFFTTIAMWDVIFSDDHYSNAKAIMCLEK
jgi:hypothetical protein